MESSTPSDCEVWTVIKFLNAEDVTGSEIHRRLSIVYGASYPNLKYDLAGWHFAVEEDLQSVIAEFFAKQDAAWYSANIRKLISCYSNCFSDYGDYVEK